MTVLPTPHECNSWDPSQPAQDRLESLICALTELKSNISAVEQRHPAFSNDLSSICDLVLDHLNRPGDTLPMANSQPCSGPQDQFDSPSSFETDQNKGPAIILDHEASKKTPLKKGNFVALIFDRAGDHMMNGLDKMGDGIIFAFEKLLSLGPKKKTGTNEDPAISPEQA